MSVDASDPATPRSCCAPARAGADPLGGPGGAASSRAPGVSLSAPGALDSRSTPHGIEQCALPAGRFVMGDASGDGIAADGERPTHDVRLSAFEIDATPVTNEEFAHFVRDTGFITDAERLGSSSVFHLLVSAPTEDIVGRIAGTPWWIDVRGAAWRTPGGRASSLLGLDDHPVVHVSWNDAQAYCAWAGRRLPSEAEWEYASRGGLAGARFPWGDDPIDGSDGTWRANVWQGTFPAHNTAADGWIATAPVRSYTPNRFGLWQTVGNVWEWCDDRFSAATYAESPLVDPRGPDHGTRRTLRGGSYLCHPSYCNRYRNSARSSNTPESSMGNAGFRTARSLP